MEKNERNQISLNQINTVYECIYLMKDKFSIMSLSEETGIHEDIVRAIIRYFMDMGIAFEIEEVVNKKRSIVPLDDDKFDTIVSNTIIKCSGEDKQSKRKWDEKKVQLELTPQEESKLSTIVDPDKELIGDNGSFLKKNHVFEPPEESYIIEILQSYIEGQRYKEGEKFIKIQYPYPSESGDIEEEERTVFPLCLIHDIESNRSYLAGTELNDKHYKIMFWRSDRIVDVMDDEPEDEQEAEQRKKRIKGIKKRKLREFIETLSMAELHYDNRGQLKKTRVELIIYDEVGVLDKMGKYIGEDADKIRREEGAGKIVRAEKYDDDEDEFQKEPVKAYYYKDDVYGINKLMSWIRGFGSSVLVLEPAEWRKKMEDLASYWRE